MAAGTLLLASCLPNTSGPAPSGVTTGPVEFWFPFGLVPAEGEVQSPVSAIIQEFNKANPGGEIQISTGNWAPEKLITAVAGGMPPDLFYMDRFLAAEFAARGVVEPLQDRLASAQGFSAKDIWPQLMNDVTLKGSVYGIPMLTDIRSLYWNRQVFEDAGLDPDTPPATWDEQLQMAVEIYKSSNGERIGYSPASGNPPGFLQWMICLWQLGGDFANSDNSKVAFNNDAGVDAMQHLLDMFDAQGGYDEVINRTTALSNGPAGVDAFILGNAGMQVGNAGYPVALEQYGADLPWSIGSLPIPEGGQKGNYNGGFALVIPKGAKNPDGAWKLIEWLLQKDNQATMGVKENLIPGRLDVAQSELYQVDGTGVTAETRRLFVEEFPSSKWVPVVPGATKILDATNRNFEEIMRKTVTPKAGIETLAEQCQVILDEAQVLLADLK
jgi:ABC-type glycerol-3-phosphate transport system substrate-binding protein